MASATKVYKVRKALKKSKQGRKRKNQLSKTGSTPSKAAFFGDAQSKSA